MNRIARVVFTICLLAAPAVFAQNSVIRISTDQKGARFRVDGLQYTQPVTFVWPTGSKHVVEIALVQLSEEKPPRTRWTFAGWKDNTGLLQGGGSTSPLFTVTADPGLTSLNAVLQIDYLVSLQFYEAPIIDGVLPNPIPVECGAPSSTLSPVPGPNEGLGMRPGVVNVNGICYNSNTGLWVTAGSAVLLNAFPYEGFVFTGWTLNSGPPDLFMRQIVVNGPMSVVPRFEPAKRVRIMTEPPGLNVMVDRTEVPTGDPQEGLTPKPYPGTFDWAAGSKHLLGAPSPQLDRVGVAWIFDSWDFGGGQNTVYTVDTQTNVPAQIKGRFVRGVNVSFLTNPPGLKLSVDGRENWPSPNFVWAVGSKHQVAANVETTDSKGRKYALKGWGHGGPAAQEITVEESALSSGLRFVVNYELMNRLTVSSSQAGVRVQVDGTQCPLPCVLDRAAGTEVRLGTPSAIDFGDGVRADFSGWSDGVAAAERSVKLDADDRRLTFGYKTMYRLQTQVEPAGAGALQVEPASADGYYAENQTVVLATEAQPGYKFRRWEGDLSSQVRTAALSMGSPKTVRAVFEKTPFIAAAGVRNAAAVTPEEAVAAGSIITIAGASLATAYEVGPASPLAQTIGGVTVRVGGRLLPLLFVSPEQINAQLPSDLAPGDYTLNVRVGMLPEVSARFQVARNAPGLFVRDVEGKAFLVAIHEGGSPVTLESPARKGELITVFGTGFGPTERPLLDGFAVPDSAQYPLADPVDVVAAGNPVRPEWAGAAPGLVGMQVIRLRVGEELPAATSVELRVGVNNAQSNTVLLPVE